MSSKEVTTESDLNKTIDNNFEFKDSFCQRFGDDLCEVILKWLPIEDNLNLRAVSYQFNACLRNVAQSQRVLRAQLRIDLDGKAPYEVSPRQYSLRLTKSRKFWVNKLIHVLKTFNNIDDISIEIFPPITYPKELLEAIVDNCRQMKSFRFEFEGIDQTIVNKFGHKFGNSLRDLDIGFSSVNTVTNLVTMCPNLISINSFEIYGDFWLNSQITTNNLKKLKHLRIGYNCQKTTFDTFVSKCLQLTHLSVSFNTNEKVSVDYMISKLSELKSLEYLRIYVSKTSQILFPSLEEIAMNCNQLKSFAIIVRYGKPIDVNLFYKHFRHFSSLNKLVLGLDSGLLSNIDLNFLKKCSNLTHLELRTNSLDDNSFEEIDEIVPNLQTLKISTNRGLTDTALNSISKLKSLRQLAIDLKFSRMSRKSSITDSGLISLINDCNDLQTIKIESTLDITEKVFIAIIENSVRKQNLYFEYKLLPKRRLNLDQLIVNYGYPMDNIIINGMTKKDRIEPNSEEGESYGSYLHLCKFY